MRQTSGTKKSHGEKVVKDILTQQGAVGKFGKRCHGRGNDFFVADHHRCGGSHDYVRRMLVVQLGDAAVFPQLFRDADDVVGKVDEHGIEIFHGHGPAALSITNRKRQAARNACLVELSEPRKNVDAQLLVGVQQVDHNPVFADLAALNPPEIERFHGDALA